MATPTLLKNNNSNLKKQNNWLRNNKHPDCFKINWHLFKSEKEMLLLCSWTLIFPLQNALWKNGKELIMWYMLEIQRWIFK